MPTKGRKHVRGFNLGSRGGTRGTPTQGAPGPPNLRRVSGGWLCPRHDRPPPNRNGPDIIAGPLVDLPENCSFAPWTIWTGRGCLVGGGRRSISVSGPETTR